MTHTTSTPYIKPMPMGEAADPFHWRNYVAGGGRDSIRDVTPHSKAPLLSNSQYIEEQEASKDDPLQQYMLNQAIAQTNQEAVPKDGSLEQYVISLKASQKVKDLEDQKNKLQQTGSSKPQGFAAAELRRRQKSKNPSQSFCK